MRIETLNEVDSTNKYIERYIGGGEDAVVFAKKQTGGMGTKGRSFSSEEGGLYYSRLRFYDNLCASEGYGVTVNASMAVIKTLLAFGVHAKIKWPNDILVGNKKICGILIKNAICGNKITHSVIGIGINVSNPLPPELSDIATSIKLETGKTIDLNALFLTLNLNLSMPADINEYKKYSAVLGKKITVLRGNERYEQTPVDILPDGRLLLQNGEALSCAELDLKIKI